MKRTIIMLIAIGIMAAGGLVHIALAQDVVYLPLIQNSSGTDVSPTTTSEATEVPTETVAVNPTDTATMMPTATSEATKVPTETVAVNPTDTATMMPTATVEATPTPSTSTGAAQTAITTGIAQNIYAGEVTSSCNSGTFRTGNYGELTDDDGTVWMVPAPVAGGFVNVDVYNDCTGNGENDYASELETQVIDEDGSEITAYLFADNYYELYVNGTFAGRDAVNFTTFNSHATRFQAEYPITYAVMLVDWEEYNGIGLEDRNGYHIGDGGFIATFSDGTMTDADWVCKTFYISPLDNDSCLVIDANGNADSSACNSSDNTVSCVSNDPENTCQAYVEELPSNWMAAEYDDSHWLPASTYTANDVTTAEGFRNYENTLFDNVDFIWTSNLDLDNGVLCRVTIEDPNQ